MFLWGVFFCPSDSCFIKPVCETNNDANFPFGIIFRYPDNNRASRDPGLSGAGIDAGVFENIFLVARVRVETYEHFIFFGSKFHPEL